MSETMEATTTVSAAQPGAMTQDSNPTTQAAAPVTASALVQPAAPARINLDDIPDFRNYKATMERKVSETARQYEARLAQQQGELEEVRRLAVANLDPDQQQEYATRSMQRELQNERKQREALEMSIAREAALRDMSVRYGVPVEDIADAQTPVEAYERILNKQVAERQSIAARLAQIEQDIAARSASASVAVVAGESISNSSGASLQQRYDNAVRGRNAPEMDKILREAEAAGATIDRQRAFRTKA